MHLFLWCSFSSLKLLISFGLNMPFNGVLKIFYWSIIKIKHRSNLIASSDFKLSQVEESLFTLVTRLAILPVFRTKVCMQHLCSLFWFSLTIWYLSASLIYIFSYKYQVSKRGHLEIFLEVNKLGGGGGVRNFFRDVGFRENSIL